MKKIIGFIGTWIMFYLGHWTAKILNRIPAEEKYKKFMDIVYEVYSKLMLWSINIQDWAKLKKPWSKSKQE